jgi:uncharacterized protein
VRGWLTLFNSRAYEERLEQLVTQPSARVLILFGDSDEFTSISSYQAWVDKLERISKRTNVETASQENQTGNDMTTSSLPTLRTVRINDASHFWGDGALRQMLSEVESFLKIIT